MRPDFVAPESAARRVALLDWAETHDVGALWSPEDARWATQQARAEGAADLRLARANHAAQRLGERDERLTQLLTRRLWSAGWPLMALVLGLLLGVGLDRLGGQQLNLLALPLWGFLALQLLAYLALFAFAWLPQRRPSEQSLPMRVWRSLVTSGARGRTAQALLHWWQLSVPLQAARGALLWHLGLLGLSLGLIAGLYLRALGLEILIGWESTYLDAPQVQRLADVLLAPASWLTGLPVPDVAPLRHGALHAPKALAATWLHLLAATVALMALPRLLLVLLAGWRSWRFARALPLVVRSGPRDLRLLVLDAQRRLTDGLLAEAGERLSSPEGDRLLVTRADHAPELLPVPWADRALARLSGAPPTADLFDLTVSADELPAATPGWPAQRRQLRALGLLWPAARRASWGRLFDAWEAPVREREEQARQLMAQTLATLALQPLALPEGVEPQAQLQRAVEQQLRLLADKLAQRYGQDAPGAAPAAAAEPWAHQVLRPRAAARKSMLGGALGGAATGLGADLAAGGLTLGAGALVGAVVGGVAGSGLMAWLRREQARQPDALQIDLAEAAPLLTGEVLAVWLAQLGLQLPAAQVQAAIDVPALMAAFQQRAPVAVQQRLVAVLAQACERLLRDSDRAAGHD